MFLSLTLKGVFLVMR